MLGDMENIIVENSNDKGQKTAKTSYFFRIWTRRRLCYLAIFLFVCIVILLPCLLVMGRTCVLPPNYNQPLSSSGTNRNADRPFNVILFGDSLIANPFAGYELAKRIQAYLPKYTLTLYNEGQGGNTIGSMLRRLSTIVDNQRYTTIDAVMMLWDSDAADTDESGMTGPQVASLRTYYRSNITAVVRGLRSRKTGVFLSIAGPVLMGESSRMSTSDDQKAFARKQQMMDDYVEINRQMANRLNVSYIDLRAAYKELLPPYRMAYDGCYTIDGEHPNSNGAQVTAKLLSQQLLVWLVGVFG